MGRLILVFVLSVSVLTSVSLARTWYITPDGTGDAPTIQAGIDSASAGDVVLVASGTYHDCTHADPDGQLNCVIMKSGVCLRSETGERDCVTIDADQQGRVIYCRNVDSSTRIEGFTVTGGLAEDGSAQNRGGGMYCLSSALTIADCVFDSNSAWIGGGMYCEHEPAPTITSCVFSHNSAQFGAGLRTNYAASPSLLDCTFSGNTAYIGGALDLVGGNPTVVGCTLFGNSAAGAAGVFCDDDTYVIMENTIIAFSPTGEALYCWPGGYAHLSCCDIYGNPAGDWTSCIWDQYGMRGNFSACPSFCHAELGDLHLCDESPCLPGNHPDGYDCGLIGAWGEGCSCGPSQTEPTTWGVIKSMYR